MPEPKQPAIEAGGDHDRHGNPPQLAHPREVYRAATRVSAAAIICAHNDPSGDLAPSGPNVQVTRQLREAAKTVDIELLDNVIVGRSDADPLAKGYCSFREAGIV